MTPLQRRHPLRPYLAGVSLWAVDQPPPPKQQIVKNKSPFFALMMAYV